MKTIILKYSTRCADCGAELKPGQRARYYGKGRAYGVDCHSKPETGSGAPRRLSKAEARARREVHDQTRAWNQTMHEEPLGLTLSRLDKHGVYTPDGRKIGSTCGCEDYPCCGH